LKKELIQHLRSKRCIRRSRHSRAGGPSRGHIVDAISIRERPAEIENRAIPGHWEGDLLGGTKNSAGNFQSWLEHPRSFPKLLGTFAAQTLAEPVRR
jgi:IS30 family transposase